jgi:hypothetical protein
MAAREEVRDGTKRGVTRRIERNKGLVRPRSTKAGTTAHSRIRSKFEKKSKSAHVPMRNKAKPYTGEAGGIRPRVVHSTKF